MIGGKYILRGNYMKFDSERLNEIYQQAEKEVLESGNQSTKSIAILAMEKALIEYRNELVNLLEHQF